MWLFKPSCAECRHSKKDELPESPVPADIKEPDYVSPAKIEILLRYRDWRCLEVIARYSGNLHVFHHNAELIRGYVVDLAKSTEEGRYCKEAVMFLHHLIDPRNEWNMWLLTWTPQLQQQQHDPSRSVFLECLALLRAPREEVINAAGGALITCTTINEMSSWVSWISKHVVVTASDELSAQKQYRLKLISLHWMLHYVYKCSKLGVHCKEQLDLKQMVEWINTRNFGSDEESYVGINVFPQTVSLTRLFMRRATTINMDDVTRDDGSASPRIRRRMNSQEIERICPVASQELDLIFRCFLSYLKLGNHACVSWIMENLPSDGCVFYFISMLTQWVESSRVTDETMLEWIVKCCCEIFTALEPQFVEVQKELCWELLEIVFKVNENLSTRLIEPYVGDDFSLKWLCGVKSKLLFTKLSKKLIENFKRLSSEVLLCWSELQVDYDLVQVVITHTIKDFHSQVISNWIDLDPQVVKTILTTTESSDIIQIVAKKVVAKPQHFNNTEFVNLFLDFKLKQLLEPFIQDDVAFDAVGGYDRLQFASLDDLMNFFQKTSKPKLLTILLGKLEALDEQKQQDWLGLLHALMTERSVRIPDVSSLLRLVEKQQIRSSVKTLLVNFADKINTKDLVKMLKLLLKEEFQFLLQILVQTELNLRPVGGVTPLIYLIRHAALNNVKIDLNCLLRIILKYITKSLVPSLTQALAMVPHLITNETITILFDKQFEAEYLDLVSWFVFKDTLFVDCYIMKLKDLLETNAKARTKLCLPYFCSLFIGFKDDRILELIKFLLENEMTGEEANIVFLTLKQTQSEELAKIILQCGKLFKIAHYSLIIRVIDQLRISDEQLIIQMMQLSKPEAPLVDYSNLLQRLIPEASDLLLDMLCVYAVEGSLEQLEMTVSYVLKLGSEETGRNFLALLINHVLLNRVNDKKIVPYLLDLTCLLLYEDYTIKPLKEKNFRLKETNAPELVYLTLNKYEIKRTIPLLVKILLQSIYESGKYADMLKMILLNYAPGIHNTSSLEYFLENKKQKIDYIVGNIHQAYTGGPEELYDLYVDVLFHFKDLLEISVNFKERLAVAEFLSSNTWQARIDSMMKSVKKVEEDMQLVFSNVLKSLHFHDVIEKTYPELPLVKSCPAKASQTELEQMAVECESPCGVFAKERKFKLCFHENVSRMRMKLTVNLNFDDHMDASQKRDKSFTVLRKRESFQSQDLRISDIPLAADLEVDDDLEGEEVVYSSSECIYVKLMAGFKGRFELTRTSISFESDIEKFELQMSDLLEVHARRYLLQRNAIEMFFKHTQVFIVFPLQHRNKVYTKLVQLAPSLRRQVIYPQEQVSSVCDDWVQGRIDNFTYLMALNTLAGRTYNDLSQYPVFPWILQDYASEKLDLNDPKVYRDLSKPIGALHPERLKRYAERYNSLPENKFYYGTHYSTSAGVLFYLLRVEPFTTLHIALQGKFDHADRQFHDLKDTFNSVLENSGDVKELIPEMFYFPEMFLNLNQFDLGTKQTGIQLNDVILPKWAKDPYEFVYLNRKALESDYVSEHLHEWIDLIFGYKQRGSEAVKAHNVFYYLTYEGAVDKVDKAMESQIRHFGQTPMQLFTHPHPKRVAQSPKWVKFDDAVVHVLKLSVRSPLIFAKFDKTLFGLTESHGFASFKLSHRGKLYVENTNQIMALFTSTKRLSKDSKFLDFNADKDIAVYDNESVKLLHNFSQIRDYGQVGNVSCVYLNKSYVAYSSDVVFVHKLDSVEATPLILYGHTDPVSAILIDEEYDLILTAANNGILFYSIKGECSHRTSIDGKVEHLFISTMADILAITKSQLYLITINAVIRKSIALPAHPVAAAFTQNSLYFALGLVDRLMIVRTFDLTVMYEIPVENLLNVGIFDNYAFAICPRSLVSIRIDS